MLQTNNELKPLSDFQQRGQTLLKRWRLATYGSVALWLVAVLFLVILPGCAIQPVVKAGVYRPPADLMTAAPTNYLLPESQQRRASSSTVPTQPSN